MKFFLFLHFLKRKHTYKNLLNKQNFAKCMKYICIMQDFFDF